VASDHQGTKAVAAQFDRVFTRSGVEFVGNTRVGIDISAAAIVEAFDIVVIATGLSCDRKLTAPQQDGTRVIGAGQILRALNGYPQQAPGALDSVQSLGSDLVVVGHGNVAIDVVRLLTKADHHFDGSDIDDRILRLLRPCAPRSIRVIGRSAAQNAKFDLAMLRELCALSTVTLRVEGLKESEPGPVTELLRQTTEAQLQSPAAGQPHPTIVTLQFQTVPSAVRLEGDRTVLDVTTASGTTASYSADSVITAIGFCHNAGEGEPEVRQEWSAPHVYSVGWCERGGRGNIAENRKHAQQTAKAIVADIESGTTPPRVTGGLAAIRDQLTQPVVSFSGWQAIDEAERQAAGATRCRRKITDIDEMLSIALANMAIAAHP
jgi:ferredoxin--NADP+ reductase